MNAKLLLWWPLCVAAVEGLSAILLNTAGRKAPLAEKVTLQERVTACMQGVWNFYPVGGV
jgi:hypothetical protein